MWLLCLGSFLSLLGRSTSATADCGNSTNVFIHPIYEAADALVLSSLCPTLWGELVIQSNASGDINLDGIANITGSLIIDTGTIITSLHSQTLQQAGGLYVTSAPVLQNIRFPNLESITSDEQISVGDAPGLNLIDLSSLQTPGEFLQVYSTPNLTSFEYPMNISLAATTWGFAIFETGLTTMNGFTENPGGFSFYGNPYLKEVNLQIKETTQTIFLPNFDAFISIQNNSDSVKMNFPLLTAVASWIALDSPFELSIAALSTVNGSFTMTNASFQSLSAPKLEFINGTLNITGSFTGIQGLPALDQIIGDVYIQSSEYIDCSPFRQISAAGKIGGQFFCQGAPSPTSSTSVPAATPTSPSVGIPSASSTSRPTGASSAHSAGLSVAARVGIAVGAAVGLGFLIFLGCLAFLSFHQRRKKKNTWYTSLLSWGSVDVLVTRVKPTKNHSVKVLIESAVSCVTILPRLVATWKRRKSFTVARSGGSTPSPR